jgi:raffinose/stachyose/melibiose transport system permease protein
MMTSRQWMINCAVKGIKGALGVILGVAALATLFPLVWILINSFKPSADVVMGKSFTLPWPLLWTGYQRALFESSILRYFMNSLLVTGSTILLTVLVSTMLAFSLTRLTWRLQGKVYALILLGILLPSQIVLVPIFILLKNLKLIDNPIGLVLTVSSFSIAMSTLIAHGFFRSIPKEMEEAAFIDGCSIFRLFFSIMLPIIKPAIATMALNIFINSWNEFIFSLVIISNEDYKTLPVGLMSFMGRYQTDWTSIFASMVIASLIPVVIFFRFSNEIEKTLTAGAILK